MNPRKAVRTRNEAIAATLASVVLSLDPQTVALAQQAEQPPPEAPTRIARPSLSRSTDLNEQRKSQAAPGMEQPRPGPNTATQLHRSAETLSRTPQQRLVPSASSGAQSVEGPATPDRVELRPPIPEMTSFAHPTGQPQSEVRSGVAVPSRNSGKSRDANPSAKPMQQAPQGTTLYKHSPPGNGDGAPKRKPGSQAASSAEASPKQFQQQAPTAEAAAVKQPKQTGSDESVPAKAGGQVGSAGSSQPATSKAKNGGKSPGKSPIPTLAPLTPQLAEPVSTIPAASPDNQSGLPPGNNGTNRGGNPGGKFAGTANGGMQPNTLRGGNSAGTANGGVPGNTMHGGAPPVAPNRNAAGMPQNNAAGALEESYPAVAKLETLTFGASNPQATIDQRLAKLEQTVLKKTFTDDSLFDRTERLKKILMGSDDYDAAAQPATPGYDQDLGQGTGVDAEVPHQQNNGGMLAAYLDELANQPENHAEMSRDQQINYMIGLINELRQKLAMQQLQPEPTANKVASEHLGDLISRSTVSHSNSKGDNPDRRYTLAGGSGALVETLVTMSRSELASTKPTRAAVAQILKKLVLRQDDREALFNSDATEVGVALDWSRERDRLYGCIETVSSHASVDPIPSDVQVGEKIEVRGTVRAPYHFERVTVAWEGNHALGSASDESEEALPYFPPLDYAAYQEKAQHDHSGTMNALRMAGVVAALAGGVFMPPVALAAPLIAMSGGMGSGEMKPVSDIPVKGGVKVDSEGSSFDAKVPINNDGKEGIYYVTVWGSVGRGTKPVPISRRAVVASGASVNELVEAKVEEEKPGKKKKHEKH